jgi:hypothetical protein
VVSTYTPFLAFGRAIHIEITVLIIKVRTACHSYLVKMTLIKVPYPIILSFHRERSVDPSAHFIILKD